MHEPGTMKSDFNERLNKILDRIPIPVVPLREHMEIRSNA